MIEQDGTTEPKKIVDTKKKKIKELQECIFKQLVISTIINSDRSFQYNFLKVYPYFRSNTDILEIWIHIYSKINIKLKKYKKYKNNKITNSIREKIEQLKKEKYSAHQFIIIGTENKYLNLNTYRKEIMDLLIKYNKSVDSIFNIQKTISFSIWNTNDMLNSKESQQKEKCHMCFKESTSTKYGIENFSSKKLAQNLTSIMFDIFIKISPHELIISTINDDCKNGENIKKIVDFFNKISLWVPTEIIKKITEKEQIKITKKFINIAKKCLELNNFLGIFAIVCGLNHNSIQKLKNIWKNNLLKRSLKKINRITDPYKNYYNYRFYINNLNLDDPIIPCIGIIQSDLKHLLENDVYQLDKQSIDLDLFDNIVKLINNFENMKKKMYHFPKNKLIQEYFEYLEVLDYENMFIQSPTTTTTTTTTTTRTIVPLNIKPKLNINWNVNGVTKWLNQIDYFQYQEALFRKKKN